MNDMMESHRILLGEPYWLLMLLIIPIMIWLKIKGKINEPSLKFSSLATVLAIPNDSRSKWIWFPSLLRYFSLCCFVVALSRPQIDRSKETILSSGVDIVLAVDLSASMLALDMSDSEQGEVTRLDVVKDVIKKFIDKRAYDRIGLVAFSVDPYLVSALTLDKEHLRRNVDRLKVGLTHQTGTNVGAALAEGINRLRPIDSKSRILILLTDGKDEPPPPHSPMVYAEGALKDKIKIYTIAIGSDSRTKTYLFDPSTRDLVKHPNGRPVVQIADYPVDKEILRKISEKTNGEFYEAKNKERLTLIYDEIDRLEKSEVELQISAIFQDLFQWPLGLGSIVLLLQVFLSRTIFLKIP